MTTGYPGTVVENEAVNDTLDRWLDSKMGDALWDLATFATRNAERYDVEHDVVEALRRCLSEWQHIARRDENEAVRG